MAMSESSGAMYHPGPKLCTSDNIQHSDHRCICQESEAQVEITYRRESEDKKVKLLQAGSE